MYTARMAKFKVKGALRETAEDVEVVIEASSYKEAERAANKMGILVSDVFVEKDQASEAPKTIHSAVEKSVLQQQSRLLIRGDFNGLGFVSCLFGVLALLICWIPAYGFCFTIVIAVIGGLLGIAGLYRTGKGRGYPIFGICFNVAALLITVVITVLVAGAAAIVIPGLLENEEYVQKLKDARREANLIAQYISDHNLDYDPDDGSVVDLRLLLLSANESTGSIPAIPPEVLIDPWGSPYEIIVPGNVNGDFDIVSWGKDGQPGGVNFDMDITQGERWR